jgi:hypothetical protein
VTAAPRGEKVATTRDGNCNPGPLTYLLPKSFTGQMRGTC